MTYLQSREEMLDRVEFTTLEPWGTVDVGDIVVCWNGSAMLNAYRLESRRPEQWQEVAVRTHYGDDRGGPMTLAMAKREAKRYQRELERGDVELDI